MYSVEQYENGVNGIISTRGEGLENIDEVMQIIESTHSIAYTRELARGEADNAINSLNCLTETPYKKALIELAHFAVERSF